MNLQGTIGCVFICLLLYYSGSGDAKLAPDYIHPCNETTRECLVKATQDAVPEFVKGIPELGISPTDPVEFDNLTVSLNNLTLTFYNGKISGFKKCIIDNVVSRLADREFSMMFHCNITVKSKYQAKGQFLLFPINGGGDAKVKLTNWNMNLDIKTKYIKDKANLYYFGIKSYKYTFEYGDHVQLDLKNLFEGSKELSDTVLRVLNENWRTVVQDFGKPFIEYAVEFILKVMKKFFLAVPFNELYNVPLPQNL